MYELKICKGIIALSATPDKIWDESNFWIKICLIDFKNKIMWDIATWNTVVPMNFLLISNNMTMIFAVLSSSAYIKLNDFYGSRTFIPAHIRR
jgi:hypothetical protein